MELTAVGDGTFSCQRCFKKILAAERCGRFVGFTTHWWHCAECVRASNWSFWKDQDIVTRVTIEHSNGHRSVLEGEACLAWQDMAHSQAVNAFVHGQPGKKLPWRHELIPPPQVCVGVAVFVYNADGAFLVGLRKGSHGAGTWSLPGGHVEFGETVAEAAAREVLEETGLIARPGTLSTVDRWVESRFERKQYITLYASVDVEGKPTPELREPEKCAEWRWVTNWTLPEPLFHPLAVYLSTP